MAERIDLLREGLINGIVGPLKSIFSEVSVSMVDNKPLTEKHPTVFSDFLINKENTRVFFICDLVSYENAYKVYIGESPDEFDIEAVGEFLNMILGKAKTWLEQKGHQASFSIPAEFHEKVDTTESETIVVSSKDQELNIEFLIKYE